MSVLEVVSFEDSWGERGWVQEARYAFPTPFHLCTPDPVCMPHSQLPYAWVEPLRHTIPCRDLSKRATMVQVLDSSLKDTAALVFLPFQRKVWYPSNGWICYFKKINDSDPTTVYLALTSSLGGFKLKHLLRVCMFPTQLFPLNSDLGDCSDPDDCC